MGVTMEMVKAYFDNEGLHYQEVRENYVLRTGWGGLSNAGKIEIIIIFDDDRTVGIRSYDLCLIPEEKKDSMYELCSDLNGRFRWVKFYVDENDNTIIVGDDAIVEADTAGEEILELMTRMASIINEAYPDIMKTLWS